MRQKTYVCNFNPNLFSQLDSSVIHRISKILTWQDQGDRFSGRRSVIIDLPTPILYSSRIAHAIKIKGAGFIDDSHQLIPPIMENYFDLTKDTYIIVNFDPKGTILVFPGEPRPIGTMLYERARHEYDITEETIHKGLPTNIPLGYGKFNKLSFLSKPVGFVLLGIEDKKDIRIGKKILDKINAVKSDQKNFESNYQNTLKIICHVSKKAGQLLRQFHQMRYINSSVQFSNLSIHAHNHTLHDLDRLTHTKNMTSAQILGWRMKDYYLLASSIGKRAYYPLFQKDRHFIFKFLQDGYFGKKTKENLLALDHLKFQTILKTGTSIFKLNSPLLNLMQNAMQEDLKL